MIGFYDYTIILTLSSLISAVLGTIQAVNGSLRLAAFCLAFSGLCDAFDGMVAHTKKNRTEDEKTYGIQLDSLCDVVAFGVFPAMICYQMGVRGVLGLAAICFYCTCAVIRLSYYNVLESNRMNQKITGEKVYHGLPVTSITVILPLVMLAGLFLPAAVMPTVLLGMLFAVGTCFIVDFTMKRPGKWLMTAIIVVVAAAVVLMTVL